MAHYHPAGQEISFSCPVSELEPYALTGAEAPPLPSPLPPPLALASRTVGWVGGEQRQAECWSAPPGLLLRVDGGSDFYIAPGGKSITRVEATPGEKGKDASPAPLTDLDRQIMLGPALVLALALGGGWCLHASAALFKNRLVAFLGESGEGKSTLAAYLAATGSPDWRLAADDILPVRLGAAGLEACPHFPQLKYPLEEQPGPSLPERLRVDKICVLAQRARSQAPAWQRLTSAEAARVLIRHTAGSRLFDRKLLEAHLAFCAAAARETPIDRLAYPRRRERLPEVRALLESSG